VAYDEALELQRTLVEERKAGHIPDTLLLLEHPHVLTLGVRLGGGRANILATPERLRSLGVSVHEAGRGGDVTYHGPGQLVGYPIIDLRPDRQDVHKYVRDIEEVLIRLCRNFGIEAERLDAASRRSPRSGCALRDGSPAMASPSTSTRTWNSLT
jgi:lipoyl(octanoyl) transferase